MVQFEPAGGGGHGAISCVAPALWLVSRVKCTYISLHVVHCCRGQHYLQAIAAGEYETRVAEILDVKHERMFS